MKKEIKVWDYAPQILEQLPKGALLTVKADGKVNTMTIGWGTLGIQWGKPIFIAYVRKSRYTKELLDKNPEFTVNFPCGDYEKSILSLCGSRSGRDLDKIEALNLTLKEPLTVSVPAICQMPLTLECKVIYQQAQDPKAIDPALDARFYAEGTPNAGDYHTAYYGEITAAYIVE